MAYAGALFADACLRGLNGDSNIFDYSYVENDKADAPFFASKVELGPDGESDVNYIRTSVHVHQCATCMPRYRANVPCSWESRQHDFVWLCQWLHCSLTVHQELGRV